MAFKELTHEEIGLNKDFTNIYKKHLVDLKKKVPYPPVAIGIGEREINGRNYPVPFGTYGNFSAIVGEPKAGKTYFKSLLTASYIGGNANHYAPDITAQRDQEAYILDFDTEQGDWHVQNTAERTAKMVGGMYQNYVPFKLREMGFKERIQFIEYCILEHPLHRKNLGLVIIDGYADLVADVNDIKECNLMVQKLMSWTEISKCHLTGIIHSNFSNAPKSKATGHLGSAVMKKAETVCYLKLEKDQQTNQRTTRVEVREARNGNIDDFGFVVNNGFPHVVQFEQLPY